MGSDGKQLSVCTEPLLLRGGDGGGGWGGSVRPLQEGVGRHEVSGVRGPFGNEPSAKKHNEVSCD